MKKAADYIAVSAFFVIVIMFAAYTLVYGPDMDLKVKRQTVQI